MATVREQQGQDFYDRRKSKKKSPLRLNREKLEQQSILVGKGVMSGESNSRRLAFIRPNPW